VAVQKLRVQVFSLGQSYTEAVFHFPIESATGGEIKIIARAQRSQTCAKRGGVERPAGMASADQDLREGRE